MENDNDKIIEIYSGTLWESEMITSLLKDAEIRSFLKNNVLQAYTYNTPYSTEVKVMIFGSDYERGKEIVDRYCRNMNNNLH